MIYLIWIDESIGFLHVHAALIIQYEKKMCQGKKKYLPR